MKKWSVLIALSLAQFILVVDTTVMNVSITALVEDLNTSVTSVQAAITIYMLTMSAFMVTGGKLGDIWGRRRAFRIGLTLFGIGSFITAISPNIATLMFGWSLVEGLGSALLMPAIAALITANYKGKDRAISFAVIGAVAAGGVAVGPIIGGAVTTLASWRWVFVGEVVIAIGVLLYSRVIRDPGVEKAPHLDGVGIVLSVVGLASLVFGVLQSSTWGWINPRQAPVIGGNEITPFGLSVVPFLIGFGLLFLAMFVFWQVHRERQGKDPLIRMGLFKIRAVSSGLSVLLTQGMIQAGILFAIPLFLQIVLGKNALQSGLALLPLSIALFAASYVAPRLAERFMPKRIIQAGLVAMTFGALVLALRFDENTASVDLIGGLALIGLGIGLLVSQVANMILSSVQPNETNEAAGLNGTAMQLGNALGTAVIGSVLVLVLAGSAIKGTEASEAFSEAQKEKIGVELRNGTQFISNSQLHSLLKEEGVPEQRADELVEINEQARLDAMSVAMFIAAGLGLMGLFAASFLPQRRLIVENDPQA